MSEYHPEETEYVLTTTGKVKEFNLEPVVGPNKFSVSNPKHRQLVIDAMLNEVRNLAKKHIVYDRNDPDIEPEYKAEYHNIMRNISFYESGLKNEVPGPWSQIFLDQAAKLAEEYERLNDPDYQKYLELKKRFEK